MAQHPAHEHQIMMCLKGEWYSLDCREEIINENHPVSCLDAEILTQYVLTPILGIEDLKSSNNIGFISGVESLEAFENKINSKEFDLGFVLFPITMQQVKKVADHQMIMPPKSTWVEPKMRSGLTIYKIDE